MRILKKSLACLLVAIIAMSAMFGCLVYADDTVVTSYEGSLIVYGSPTSIDVGSTDAVTYQVKVNNGEAVNPVAALVTISSTLGAVTDVNLVMVNDSEEIVAINFVKEADVNIKDGVATVLLEAAALDADHYWSSAVLDVTVQPTADLAVGTYTVDASAVSETVGGATYDEIPIIYSSDYLEVVIAEPVGVEGNPYQVLDTEAAYMNYFVLKNDATTYFELPETAVGKIVTIINSNEFAAIYNGVDYTSAYSMADWGNIVSFEVVAGALSFTTTCATADSSVNIKVAAPPAVGEMGNPEIIEGTKDYALTETWEYHYQYTATADDTVTITMKDENDWVLWVNDNEAVYSESVDGAYTVTVTLAEGDVLAIVMGYNNYDDPDDDDVINWNFTVGEVADECDHADATLTFNSKTETAFVYDYTCSCGATGQKPLVIGTDYAGTVATKKTISPTNDIAMTFRFATAGITDYTNLIAVISKQKYAKNATESTIEEHYITTVDTSSSGYYSFKFSDVAAYEMNNDITCTLYGMNSDKEMIKLGAVENYSVCDYVTNTLATYASSTSTSVVNLKRALVDLLVYGAKAQVLGSFNVANLASSVLTDDQLALGTPASDYCTPDSVWNTLPEAAGDLEGATEANKVTLTKTLNPAEKVYVQFTLKTHAADINNYSVKFNYYDTKGNPQETEILTFAEAGFTKYKTDGVTINSQGFEFALAPITTFDYPVTATIYCDGVAVHEVVYSIEAYIKSYCKYAGNSNAALDNLGQFVQSMYAYGRSMAIAAKVTSYADFIA